MISGAVKRRLRLRNSQKFDTHPKMPAVGTISDAISALCQVLLAALAIWGIFFSNAGDRLVASLRTDVSEARGALTDLRYQRTRLEAELREQKSELNSNQLVLLRTEAQMGNALDTLHNTLEFLEESQNKLNESQDRVEVLSHSLSVTIPARKRYVCDRLQQGLGFLVIRSGLRGLMPQYRWSLFRLSARNTKFTRWADLESAFQKWSQDNKPIGSVSASAAQLGDYAISMRLSTQAHIDSLTDQEKYLMRRLYEPVSLNIEFDISSSRSRPLGSLASVEHQNPWDSIASTIESDPLTQWDAQYSQWQDQVRRILLNHREAFDFAFPLDIPQKTSYDDMEDVAVLYVRYMNHLDSVFSELKSVCA
jgi:hypothetical protein